MVLGFAPKKVFNLTYLGVTVLAYATTVPPKTQVKTALGGPFGRRKYGEDIPFDAEVR
jgi:hypothetical protein